MVAALGEKHRTDRDLAEMLGLIKGTLADGLVHDDEVVFLRRWADRHPDAMSHWSVRTVYDRIARHLDDGILDHDERQDLHDLLMSLTGGFVTLQTDEEGSTTLPLDNPPSEIFWSGAVYVFTGKFAYGTRADCEREVFHRGGDCEPRISKRTTFLVIGTFGSRDWIQSSFGRKIEKAAELRATGTGLRIVHEDHWAKHL